MPRTYLNILTLPFSFFFPQVFILITGNTTTLKQTIKEDALPYSSNELVPVTKSIDSLVSQTSLVYSP
jgi:hypothetical protein